MWKKTECTVFPGQYGGVYILQGCFIDIGEMKYLSGASEVTLKIMRRTNGLQTTAKHIKVRIVWKKRECTVFPGQYGGVL